jgi:hypothetical protein
MQPDEQRRALGLAALTALIERADEIQRSDADLLAAIIDQVDLSNQQTAPIEDGHDRGTPTDGSPDPGGPGASGPGSPDEPDVAQLGARTGRKGAGARRRRPPDQGTPPGDE